MRRLTFLIGLFFLTILGCKNPKPKEQSIVKQQDTVPVVRKQKNVKRELKFTKYADLRSFVRIVKFSPDGKYLVAGNMQLAIFKHTNTGFSLVRILSAHRDRINAIDFSNDGKLLATASDDSTVVIYDFKGEKTKILKRLTDFTADLVTLAFSPDGSKLACATNNDSIFVYNVTDGFSLITKFENFGVQDVKFTHNSKFLVVSSLIDYDYNYQGGITVYDTGNDFSMTDSLDLEPMVYNISISPDDKEVLAVGTDRSYLFNFTQGSLSNKQLLHLYGDLNAIFVNDSVIIATDSTKPDITSQKFIFISNLEDDQTSYQDIDFNTKDTLLAISYADGKIFVYKLEDTSLIKYAILRDYPVSVYSIALYNNTLVAGCGDGSSWADIRILNLDEPLNTGKSLLDTIYNQVESVVISKSGKLLIAGDWRGNIFVFNKTADEFKLSQKFFVSDNSLYLSLSNDENYLIVGYGRILELYKRIENKFTIVRKQLLGADIQSVAISPNGQLLAIADNSQSLKLLNVNDFSDSTNILLANYVRDKEDKLVGFVSDSLLAVLLEYPANKMILFSLDSSKVTVKQTLNFQGDANKFKFSPGGEYLATVVGSNIEIYKNSATGYKLLKGFNNIYQIEALGFSAQYFAFATGDGIVVYK